MRFLGFDTETYLIAPGNVAPRMVCLTTCDEDGEVGLFTREEALPLLHALFDAPGITFVAHHARFDMAVLAAADGTLLPKIFRLYDEGRVRCTMVREKLLALARGELADEGDTGARRNIKFSLAGCVQRHFGIDISEDKKNPNAWRLRYAELDNAPVAEWPEKARRYALDDARWPLAVFDAQTRVLHENGGEGDCIPDELPQVRGAFWLYLASVRGVRTDVVAVNTLNTELSAEYARMNALVRAAGVLLPKMEKGEMVWSKNMAALRERVVFAYGGEENAPKTEKGAIATDRETLTSVADARVMGWLTETEKAERDERAAAGLPKLDGEQTAALLRDLCAVAAARFDLEEARIYNWLVLSALGERSGIEKLLGTYVPVLFDGTQLPINPSFNELVGSGRSSCYDPNLQNPPRKGGIRECFIPRFGFLYAFCDYSFIELCTLAQSCLEMFTWSAMADAINAGLDPHLDMAASMLGISYEEAVARKKAGDKQIGEFRQMSKALNFGFPGGLGKAKFVEYARAGYGVNISEQEAGRRKEEWYTKWPEMRQYHAHFGQLTLGDRKFTLVQPGSGRVRGEVGFCDGSNCVDYETEALTRRGWVRGGDLRLDDFILTKNAETGRLEWQQPLHIFHYPEYSGPLVEFESTRFSAVTTPEHRWLVNDKKGRVRCVQTKDISPHGDHRIHRSGEYVGDEAPYSDDFLQLAGWFLTDGTVDSHRIRIYQTKPETVVQIDALFERLGFPVSRSEPESRKVNGKPAVVWSFSDTAIHRTGLSSSTTSSRNPVGTNTGRTAADYLRAGMGTEPDTVVASRLGVTMAAVGAMRRRHGVARPLRGKHTAASDLRTLFPDRLLTQEFVVGLSGRQARVLLETMMLGDGTVSERGQGHFFTRDERCADAFQTLLVLAGQASKAAWRDLSQRQIPKYDSMPNSPKSGGIWTVDLYKRDTAQVLKHQVREVEARGVWCPSVPNSYFVARRNKKVYVTGNSVFQGRAADGIKRAGWYIAQECYTGYSKYWTREEHGAQRSPLFGSFIVLMLHDELILEVPEAKAHEAVNRQSEVMILGMREVVPDVKVGTEFAIARRWYKGAAAVYGPDGRIQPWEPKKKS